MNKYSEMSDFEINKAVAKAHLNGGYLFSDENQKVYLAGMDGWEFLPNGSFDPCNNPSDAMPIIIDNEISLIKTYDSGWRAINEWGVSFCAHNENPLRAAMEVFLMMKDSE